MRRLSGLFIFFLLSLGTCPAFAQSVSENDWQVAFNRLVLHGQLEVTIPTGRVDILTDEYAVEVDHVRNYRAGIKQALQYAAATKRNAGLALIIDGDGDTAQAAWAMPGQGRSN